jgi:hypothetical protein
MQRVAGFPKETSFSFTIPDKNDSGSFQVILNKIKREILESFAKELKLQKIESELFTKINRILDNEDNSKEVVSTLTPFLVSVFKKIKVPSHFFYKKDQNYIKQFLTRKFVEVFTFAVYLIEMDNGQYVYEILNEKTIPQGFEVLQNLAYLHLFDIFRLINTIEERCPNTCYVSFLEELNRTIGTKEISTIYGIQIVNILNKTLNKVSSEEDKAIVFMDKILKVKKGARNTFVKVYELLTRTNFNHDFFLDLLLFYMERMKYFDHTKESFYEIVAKELVNLQKILKNKRNMDNKNFQKLLEKWKDEREKSSSCYFEKLATKV